MKFVRECVLLLLLALAIGRPGSALATPTCTGRFANPITDICWRCMLPIRFGGLESALHGAGRHAESRRLTALCVPLAIARGFQGELSGSQSGGSMWCVARSA
jgi:hypothetical protein